MKTLRTSSLCLLLCLVVAAPLGAATTAELERRLDRQERRIDSLERALENLQYQLSNQPPPASGSRPATQTSADPLIGTWECTNNIFTYEIAFHANGLMIQEEPTFSKIRSGRWTRSQGDQFVTEGHTWQANFHDDNEVTIINLADQATWDCYRKQ